MEKFKKITEDDIEALDYLSNINSETDNDIIKTMCSTYELTVPFVLKFYDLMTPELVSNSPNLSSDVATIYPEFFDKEIWKQSTNKSLDILISPAISNQFTDNEITDLLKNVNGYRISEMFFNLKFDLLTEEQQKIVLNKYKGYISEDFLLEHNRLLNSDLTKNKKLADVLDNKDSVENIIRTKENIKPKFLISLLIKIKKPTWRENILNEVLNGSINVENSGETFDEILIDAVNSFHEDTLILVFKILKEKDRNAITYNVLDKLLTVKDPSEELCLYLKDDFKQAGLFKELKEYCEDNYIDIGE